MSTGTPIAGDGVITIPGTKGDGSMAASGTETSVDDYFMQRLKADRDRHSTNATTFEKVLEMQYAQGMQFREANAARVVLESGSGRTRSETNGPGNTAAPDK